MSQERTGCPSVRRSLIAISAASIAATVLLTGCNTTAGPPRAATDSSTGTNGSAKYQLHMTFFSTESNLTPVIDPQIFMADAAAAAGIGPQQISHAAGVAPAAQSGADSTPLFAADGSQLKVTLGQWEKAAGTVTFTCEHKKETADSALTGLIPSALYSVFVVHLRISGAARFTPWGDAAGTDNSFTASATGTAQPSNTVRGCLGPNSAAVVVWHSDGKTHGSIPGTIGQNWHNSVIAPLP